jgi:hypothetical protein
MKNNLGELLKNFRPNEKSGMHYMTKILISKHSYELASVSHKYKTKMYVSVLLLSFGQ